MIVFVKNLTLNGLGMSDFAGNGPEMTVFEKNLVPDGPEMTVFVVIGLEMTFLMAGFNGCCPVFLGLMGLYV